MGHLDEAQVDEVAFLDGGEHLVVDLVDALEHLVACVVAYEGELNRVAYVEGWNLVVDGAESNLDDLLVACGGGALVGKLVAFLGAFDETFLDEEACAGRHEA